MTDPQAALDIAMMERAITLAARGVLTARPNPAVGCVLAHGEHIVGEGFHQRAGQPHAEVHALRAAGDAARGATAYVTLEPCAHHGRTPPCASALVDAGVARVVTAGLDPNPKVAGAGLALIREHGIATDAGLLASAARELNPGFLARHERGRPWLRLKLATSLDGRTALPNGVSQWITSPEARADVQHWRARSGAILTGADTVIADDPAHTVRIKADGSACDARDSDVPAPLRLIADTRLRTPAHANLLTQPGRVVVAHAREAGTQPALVAAGAELLETPSDASGLDLAWLMQWLASEDINDVFTEAGPRLLGALLRAELVDEVLWYMAPNLLGIGAREALAVGPFASMAERLNLILLEHSRVGPDLRLRLKPATIAFAATDN